MNKQYSDHDRLNSEVGKNCLNGFCSVSKPLIGVRLASKIRTNLANRQQCFQQCFLPY